MTQREVAGGGMGRIRGPAVTREQPWPGLMPFTEEARDFFHGRDEEVSELLRQIRRQTLTVFFGLSGLGKSSLVNAGLFPRLREEDFLPIYIRLDVLSLEPLTRQALRVLAESARAHGVEAPVVRDEDNLWDYLHRRDADFWSSKNRLLTPVLVFDQFEELFTLGRHSEDVVQRCRAFLDDLADLVEGRTPAATIARIERDPARADEIDYARETFKVLLSFREDYLPDFEALRGTMPSIMRGRMRLTRMNGSQARAAILESGGHLVTEAVAERIIRFVASARSRGGSEDGDLARLEVEPALLSVVCRELNNKRIAARLSHISTDLLEGEAQQEIIREFYEENLADLDPRIAEFIEDQLLTEAGYRDSCALEDALRLPGVTREDIDTLIGRRLVRLDERAGVLRVELTHDVLTKVAKDGRDQRKQREAERIEAAKEAARRRKVRGWIAVGAVVAICSVGLAATFALLLEKSNQEKRLLVETQSNVLLEQSIGQLERNVPSEPQAILAESMRLNPANAAAVARSVTYLSQRPFARETSERKVPNPEKGVDLRARAVFNISKTSLSVSDLDDGKALGPERTLAREPAAMAIAADRSRIAWDDGPGRVTVATLKGAESHLAIEGEEGEAIRHLALSPDGRALLVRTAAGPHLYLLEPRVEPVALPASQREIAMRDGPVAMTQGAEWIAFGDRRSAVAWNRVDKHEVKLPHPSPLNALEFSADGRYLVTGSQDKNARIWEVRTARLVGAPLPHEGAVLSASFDLRGEQLVTGSLDRTARIWKLGPNAPTVDSLVGTTPVIQARAHAERRGATTLDATGRLAFWELVPPDPPIAVGTAQEPPSAIEQSPDGRVVVTVSNAGVRLQEAGPAGFSQRWQVVPQSGAAIASRIDRDARLVAVATSAGPVELRDARTGQLLHSIPQAKPARLLEFDRKGRLIAIVGEDDVLRLWNAATGARIGLPIDGEGRLVRLEFSADGELLMALKAGGAVTVWDASSTLPVATINPTAASKLVPFAGFTGEHWALAVVEDRRARLVEVRKARGGGYEVAVHSELPFLTQAWTAAISAESRRLVVGAIDGTARVIDTTSFRLVGSAMKHEGVVLACAFSGDGRWIITRTEQAAYLWHGASGYPVADPVRFEGGVASAYLLGGGAMLLARENGQPHQLIRVHLDFPAPGPAWLPALVELAGRGRFDRSGGVAPIEQPRSEIATLRTAIDKEPAASWWRQWASGVVARLDGKGVAR